MTENLARVVRDLDERLLRRYGDDLEMMEILRDFQRKHGILHDDRPICPFFRPYFLERSRYDAISAAAFGLHRAFERMTEAALEDHSIIDELGLTEKEDFTSRIDPRYSGLCTSSRFDTFLHGNDFKFLEYNAETPAGVGDQIALGELFDRVPEIADFLADYRHFRPQPQIALLESLVAAYRESGGRKEKPNIAIVDWDGVSTAAEFEILRDYWESCGHRTIITNPDSFDYDGNALLAGEFEVDIFYKRVIIHEFLERYDETHPLIRAYTDGNVTMSNNFRVKIAHKKTSFAILSDDKYAHLFTEAQRDLISRHIPWTRRIRDDRTTYRGMEFDLLELLRRERDSFLMKPHDDYGGHGVHFGWETTHSEWDSLIEEALKGIFVVQERAPVDKTVIPTFGDELTLQELTVDFDPFLFRGRVTGGLVRLASGSLVNVTQGGGETALVVLEGF